MREMKDSGIEWIGKIPADWTLQRGKTIFAQRLTKGNQSEILLAATQKYGMLPQSEVEGVVQVKEDADLQQFRTVHKKDFVISLRSFQGGFEYSQYEGVCSPAYQVFYNTNPICHNYYRLLFKSDGFIQKMNSMTVGIREGKNIQYSDFANSLIPVPPINQQQRIADYLDRKCSQIDTIIARQQEVIEKLKAYKLSVITEAVTKGLNPNVPMKDSGVEWIGAIPDFWDVVPLKTCSDILPGYAFSSDDFDTENGTALLRGINVTPNRVRWEDVVYWNKPITEQLRAFELVAGDIVVGLDRPWVSGGTRVCWVTQKDLPALLLQRVCRIRAKENIDSRWIYHWIASKSFQEALSIETTGVSVPHISTKQIGQFSIAFPPIEVQRQICDILEVKHYSIDTMVSKKQVIIDKLTEYKKSLIYEVVTGKKEV